MLGVANFTMNSTIPYPQDSIPPFPLHAGRRNSAYSSVDSRTRSTDYYARATNESARIFSIPSPSSSCTLSSRYSSRESLRTPPSEGTMSSHSVDYSTALLPTSGNVQNSRSQYRQYDHSQSSIPSMSECFRSSSQSQEIVKRKASPPSRRGSFAQQVEGSSRGRRSSTAVPPLTVPASINSSKGSLAEFAAQITCLFWFESSHDLAKVASSVTKVIPTTPLIEDAVPSMSFKKWVATILSTTQVSQNVILLALLFIYRLKKLNPSVKGKVGSEYRLLTVALMLGNKFLDDNTYTNKTWAEVSGITVGEIHVMEVEFLSNMRYSLFTSAEEWQDWHVKLGKFGEYWDRARCIPKLSPSHQFSSITPTSTVPPSLPSPPHSNHASPPYGSSHSPSSAYPPALPTLPVANVSPKNTSLLQRYREDFDRLESSSRKRTLEDTGMHPPAKRLSRSGPSSSTMLAQYPPALTIPTPSPNPYASQQPINPNAPMPTPPAALQPQVQPYYPTTRAMSTVYPSPSSVWTPPQAATSSWNHPTAQLPVASTSATQAPVNGISLAPYPTSRHTSPYPLSSSNNSPTAYSNNSPSIFLTSRESPYRPVRTVSALLVPQQSTEAQHLGQDQMQYQPLTKARNEYRQGPVPYMQTEYWPQSTNWSLPPSFEP
ncbi:hypothetical protein TWF102_007721 [Orbilia oligospora]|uniref:Uncharacterized protein n=1 Tax=Orbilia oligospora TaxID=2813651 RepID=A0A7C8JVC4_ORBOL|nr:hypothetical protein TWF102_007721 [Orbilia oligospora]KAF3109437.1 hypothetical protein TWF706_001309 [Orbilia oligospora]KAF3134114.1 hypothetical protein TWF703_006446 [Orbilia oligospora]